MESKRKSSITQRCNQKHLTFKKLTFSSPKHKRIAYNMYMKMELWLPIHAKHLNCLTSASTYHIRKMYTKLSKARLNINQFCCAECTHINQFFSVQIAQVNNPLQFEKWKRYVFATQTKKQKLKKSFSFGNGYLISPLKPYSWGNIRCHGL